MYMALIRLSWSARKSAIIRARVFNGEGEKNSLVFGVEKSAMKTDGKSLGLGEEKRINIKTNKNSTKQNRGKCMSGASVA